MLLLYGDGVLIITWAAGPAPESHFTIYSVHAVPGTSCCRLYSLGILELQGIYWEVLSISGQKEARPGWWRSINAVILGGPRNP